MNQIKFFSVIIAGFVLLVTARAAEAVTIYRSVGAGANTTLRAAGSTTLNITGTTATFSTDLANKIGVGDAIQYDADNNTTVESIAFIAGRTSTTVFTVQSASGGTPTPTTVNDNNWSIYRAYTSLNNAVGSTGGTENTGIAAAVRNFDTWSGGRNIVTNTETWHIALYGNGTNTDTTAAPISSSWTTNATYYLRIYTPYLTTEVGTTQRHAGKWDSNLYVMAVTNTSGITVQPPYTRIEGVQVRMVAANSNYKNILIATTAAGPAYIFSNICWGSGSTSSWADGIEPWFSGVGDVYIYNNILYNFKPVGGGGAIEVWSANSTVYVYNNTIYDSIAGVRADTQTAIYAKNNLVTDTTTAMVGTFSAGTDYNATNNASMGYTVTGGGNTHDRLSQTFSFVDKTGYDLHITGSDAGAREYGVSLAADPVIPFSADIEGDLRPIGTSWDIGADEVGTNLYRSVGTTATDLKTVGATVSISGNTATFSLDMPDNVGVGDAVVYGSTNIAFISGRTSARIYTVQDATGGTPTAAGLGTSVAVYRCYLSLTRWEANTLGQENANIDAAVDDLVILPSTDLVTAGKVMMVPCYADGADATATTVAGWTTGPTNYIKIYTPVTTAEVGVTQRHTGKWGDGYRRSANFYVSEEYVRLDGISLWQAAIDRIYFFTGSTGVGEIHVSNCFGLYTGQTGYGYDVFDVWSVGALTVKFWNCIGVTTSPDANAEAFYNNDVDSTVFFYNCTGIANAGRGFRTVFSTNPVTVKNCLGTSVSGTAFAGNFTSNIYSASNDATADDRSGAGARINQTFSFVDAANFDYHLLPTDMGAREYGTSLLADSVIPISTDIDGNTRYKGSGWDIGADETAFTGAPSFTMGMEF